LFSPEGTTEPPISANRKLRSFTDTLLFARRKQFPPCRGFLLVHHRSVRRVVIIALALVLALALIGTLIGCSPKWNAKRHLRPVVHEIESFKKKEGRAPESLDELQAKSGKSLKVVELSDVGLIWSIKYEKKSAQSYKIGFHHVHYTLYYADGEETGWNFNPFR
jgi:hypothetical protein